MSHHKDFEEYIRNLKEESERGAVPNHEVPIEKFVKVAHNIITRVEESKPVTSMYCLVERSAFSV